MSITVAQTAQRQGCLELSPLPVEMSVASGTEDNVGRVISLRVVFSLSLVCAKHYDGACGASIHVTCSILYTYVHWVIQASLPNAFFFFFFSNC